MAASDQADDANFPGYHKALAADRASWCTFLQYHFRTSVMILILRTALFDLQWQMAHCWETSVTLHCCVSVGFMWEAIWCYRIKEQWFQKPKWWSTLFYTFSVLWEALTMEATPGLGKATSSRKLPAVLQCFDLQASSFRSAPHPQLNNVWLASCTAVTERCHPKMETHIFSISDGFSWLKAVQKYKGNSSNIFSKFCGLGI